MARITITRTIEAPLDAVFSTVSDIRNFSKAIPHIVDVTFLTETKTGVGTRFRETRIMHGKESSTELEVTEFVSNEKIRLVADSHGTIWDTVFEVKTVPAGSQLTMTMDSRPYKLTQKLMVPLINGMIRSAVAKDMDSVKDYCEGKR